MLRYKRLYVDSPEFTRPNPGDAGYDLRAYGDYTLVGPDNPVSMSTGIAVEIPDGWVGLVLPRSGLRFKNQVNTFGVGVIDSSYRGEIKVMLEFSTTAPIWYHVNHGDKIAQLVIVPYFSDDIEEVPELSSTLRGENGFGSTGR